MVRSVSTSMHFLEDNILYQSVKPYTIIFKPPDGFPKTNICLEEQSDIVVEDIRGRERDFTMDQAGFTIMELQSQLLYKEFSDDEKVIDVYLKEVADSLQKHLGAERVQIYEHLVCSAYSISVLR